MVTVTVSIDCLPLAAVITSSPHCAGALGAGPPYCCCCWTGQFIPAPDTEGTVPVMTRSPQATPVKACAMPSLPTKATVPVVVPKLYFRGTAFWLKGDAVAEGPE